MVNDDFHLRGMITVKDIQKAKDNPHACKDEQERLRVGAAVGTGAGTEERVEALILPLFLLEELFVQKI